MTDNSKTIACIGWGSLVWDPRSLPLHGTWQNDGPPLPVEFARESGTRPGKRCISLVICADVPRVQTCWALLDVPDIRTARDELGRREYEEAKPNWIEANIGFWDGASGTSSGMEAETIAAWAAERGFAGAVWTSLPCGFRKIRGTMPTVQAVVSYLRALDAVDKPGAEKYARSAPPQIDTSYRRAIAEALGWTPLP